MGDRSGIEWTDATWNPVTGCTKVSPGCAHCYAEAVTLRFKRGGPYLPGQSTITLHPDRLDQPSRWQRPRRVFVCSMSDLFHEQVPFAFVDRIVREMDSARQHTFQVLTKRPERMLEYLAWPDSFLGFSTWPSPHLARRVRRESVLGRPENPPADAGHPPRAVAIGRASAEGRRPDPVPRRDRLGGRGRGVGAEGPPHRT